MLLKVLLPKRLISNYCQSLFKTEHGFKNFSIFYKIVKEHFQKLLFELIPWSNNAYQIRNFQSLGIPMFKANFLSWFFILLFILLVFVSLIHISFQEKYFKLIKPCSNNAFNINHPRNSFFALIWVLVLKEHVF